MSARVPLCAKCGAKPTPKTGRVVEEWRGVKGRPRVATCWGCHDGVPWTHGGPESKPLAPVLRQILARGEGRVLIFGGVSVADMLASTEALDAEGGQ